MYIREFKLKIIVWNISNLFFSNITQLYTNQKCAPKLFAYGALFYRFGDRYFTFADSATLSKWLVTPLNAWRGECKLGTSDGQVMLGYLIINFAPQNVQMVYEKPIFYDIPHKITWSLLVLIAEIFHFHYLFKRKANLSVYGLE